MIEQFNINFVFNREDGPVEPSLKLSNLVNEVIEELKDRASEYTDIEPVIVPGVKLFNMGTWGTFSGGFLGLPAYFECTSVDEISKIVEVSIIYLLKMLAVI